MSTRGRRIIYIWLSRTSGIQLLWVERGASFLLASSFHLLQVAP